MSKRLGGIIGCKDKTSYGIETDSPMIVLLGQQYNVGEKPTVILLYIVLRNSGIMPNSTVYRTVQYITQSKSVLVK